MPEDIQRIPLAFGHNPLNLEPTINGSQRNKGVWRDFPCSLPDLRDASGLVLTGGTSPSIAAASSVLRVRWASGNAAAATFQWQVPREFDQDMDRLALRLNIVRGGIAEASAFDATAIVVRNGTALVGAFASNSNVPSVTAAAAPQTLALSTNPQVVTIPFYYRSIRPGDSLQFTIAPTGTGHTSTLDLTGFSVSAICDAAFYTFSERFA